MSDASETIGLVLVCRDEERFVRQNLAFHRAAGVGRAYVYLDRCADGTEAIARSFDFAEVIPRDRGAAHAFMSSYQTDVLADALARARRDGIDWLLHVDADEFTSGESTDLPGLVARAATRLRGFGRRVDQLILRTVEAVPTPLTEGQTFADLCWFQDGGVLGRDVLDPTDGTVKRLDHWLGGRRGKSMVRVAAEVEPDSAHAWRRAGGGTLTTVRAGLHYHYVVTDWRHWLEKYRKFSEYPATWEKGDAVRFPKQAWKEASVAMADAEAKAYFDRWVAVPAGELAAMSKTPAGKHLRHDPTVLHSLTALGVA